MYVCGSTVVFHQCVSHTHNYQSNRIKCGNYVNRLCSYFPHFCRHSPPCSFYSISYSVCLLDSAPSVLDLQP